MSSDTEAKTSNATVTLRFLGLDKEVEAQVGDNILDVALRHESREDHQGRRVPGGIHRG